MGPSVPKILLGFTFASLVGCNCGKGPGALQGDVGEGSATNVAFGSVGVGQPSSPQPVTIVNNGPAPLSLESTSFGGADPGDFSVSKRFPASLAPGGRASATLIFTPGAVGPRSATFQIQTDGDPQVVTSTLTGTGVALALCASPSPVDFGQVQVQGTPGQQTATVTNCGMSAALFVLGSISGPQASEFSVQTVAPTMLAPGDQLSLTVSYAPAAVEMSAANLAFQGCDTNGDCESQGLPLQGSGVEGALSFSPDPLTFNNDPVGQTITQTVTANNNGTESITVTGLTTQSGKTAVFDPVTSGLPVMIAAGAQAQFTVSYTPTGAAGGDSDVLVGTFTVADPSIPPGQAQDPLQGNAAGAPCSIGVSPASLGFGNIPPAVATTYAVTVTNLSPTDSCAISSVALASNSDPSFSLPATQPTSFMLAPNAGAKIQVTADPLNANPPLSKNGTLVFDTNGTPATVSVPLIAFVDADCAATASQVIYTVDEDGTFSSFDPTTLTFTRIGTLNCPNDDFGLAGPFSMAVDQNAVAWVNYTLSGALYEVSTYDAGCASTSYVPNQDNLTNYGMSFVSDPSTGADTLYVAGGENESPTPSELATISFPQLSVTNVGQVSLGWPELTGTGDGQLWGFFPANLSVGGTALLAQLDPKTGAEIMSYSVPQLSGNDAGVNFALKFSGGAFWLFYQTSVYEILRSDGGFSTPVPNSHHSVVGAGVSTCAPVQSQ